MWGENLDCPVRIRRYVNPEASDQVTFSVIVPSLNGLKNGRLAALEGFLRNQSFRDFEVIQVLGDPRQGRAINRGFRASRGRYLITLDDDSEIYDPHTFKKLKEAFEKDPSIGIAGTGTLPSPTSSAYQRMAAKQVPRQYFPVLRRTTDSDMAQHGCMAIRREVFEAVGGEDENLVRGLDPVLRYKVRERGYRVVVVAGAWISHPLPRNLGGLVARFFRNGRGSAFAAVNYPERVFELTDGFRKNRFCPKRPLWFRAIRWIFHFYVACMGLQVFRVFASLAYALGYAYELAKHIVGKTKGKACCVA